MDSEGAKGYVQFRVKPNPGYAVGDIITNTASIFFDFNPVIVTNTFNTEFVQQLATNQYEQNSFAFWPNPASGTLTVTAADGQSIASVAIYDMLGKAVYSTKMQAETQNIDVSQISTGMYFIEVTTSGNVKTTKKLMIK